MMVMLHGKRLDIGVDFWCYCCYCYCCCWCFEHVLVRSSLAFGCDGELLLWMLLLLFAFVVVVVVV